MKICILTTGFPRFEGDLCANFVLDFAAAVTAQGCEVSVVCPHEAGLPLREKVAGVNIRRFRYAFPASAQRLAYADGIPTNISRSWLARAEIPGFLLAMALAARKESRNADIVHAQWAISGFAAPASRRPLVLTVRGSDIKLSGRGLIRLLYRRAFRKSRRIFAVSEDLGSDLVSAGVSTAKIRVMPNGVDMVKFSCRERNAAREKLGLSRDAFIALFCGQIVPVKNPAMIAEALGLLKDVPALRIHMVGDGSETESVRAVAAGAGVAERIIFHGKQPHDSIPDWLAACDCLVLSSFSEGRPNVILEAMAAGRPVVATRVGGVPELVVHGETGLLTESGNAQTFAEAVRFLAADRNRCDQMGRAGRTRIEALGLSWDAVAARHLAIYEEVLREARDQS